MKNIIFVLGCFISIHTNAQDDILNAFDFWVGTWEATWTDANGKIIKGENVITKSCEGNVVVENFSDTTNQFFGTSISVFSTIDSTWHQAWADNSGGYLDLTGIIEGETRIFQTKVRKVGEVENVRRMIFYNITKDAFEWDWEASTDGGKTWTLAWHISYVRKG